MESPRHLTYNINQVNVIIMAGGKGSRLSSMVSGIPKSLVRINDKPLVHYLIEHLISFGVQNLYISVGYLKEEIIDNVGAGSQWGINIEYIHEECPLGSIGALSQPYSWRHNEFLVINGDILTNFNVNDVLNAFNLKSSDMVVLTTRRQLQLQYGILNTSNEGDIVRLDEKPNWEFVINAGIYFFNKSILDLIPKSTKTEGWELIQIAIKSGCKVVEVPLENAYWIDIGTPETLSEALIMMSSTPVTSNQYGSISQ